MGAVTGYPFKPGDWAVDPLTERVARVIRVYDIGDEMLFDLSIYAFSGDRIGRASPPEGGPKTFEPACPMHSWERIKKPSFPMEPVWRPNTDGTRSLRYWAGERLPPANWTPPKRTAKTTAKADIPWFTGEELRHLADLFDGANDPLSASIGEKAKLMFNFSASNEARKMNS